MKKIKIIILTIIFTLSIFNIVNAKDEKVPLKIREAFSTYWQGCVSKTSDDDRDDYTNNFFEVNKFSEEEYSELIDYFDAQLNRLANSEIGTFGPVKQAFDRYKEKNPTTGNSSSESGSSGGSSSEGSSSGSSSSGSSSSGSSSSGSSSSGSSSSGSSSSGSSSSGSSSSGSSSSGSNSSGSSSSEGSSSGGGTSGGSGLEFDPEELKEIYGEQDDTYHNMGGKLLSVVTYICYGAAIIIIIYKGVQLMYKAPEAKAELKKELVNCAIGALILFSIGTIIQIIGNIALNNLIG